MAGNDNNVEFKQGDFVVYPAHGVGKIEGVETQTISGMQISRDPEVLRSVDEGVKRLAEYAAKYGVKHDPNGARVSAARQQLDAVRGELDKALREQRWFEAGKLLAPFADAPPETAGELNVLRRKLELQSRADAESTQRRALEFERDRGARFRRRTA